MLLADGGDITFQNNVMYAGGTDPIANAILTDGKHTMELAPRRTHHCLYDPIVMQDEQDNASSLHLNQGEDCQGEILFSGRDYADSDNAANYTSTLTGDAFQYNGTVRLDQRAALQLVNYVQEGGTLAMGRQTSLTASGNVSLKTLTLDLSLSGEPAHHRRWFRLRQSSDCLCTFFRCGPGRNRSDHHSGLFRRHSSRNRRPQGCHAG